MNAIHPRLVGFLKARDKLLMQWVSRMVLPDRGNTVLGDDQAVNPFGDQ